MNNIEEQLWNYIDGSCAADERSAISKLIAAAGGNWRLAWVAVAVGLQWRPCPGAKVLVGGT